MGIGSNSLKTNLCRTCNSSSPTNMGRSFLESFLPINTDVNWKSKRAWITYFSGSFINFSKQSLINGRNNETEQHCLRYSADKPLGPGLFCNDNWKIASLIS